MNRLSARDEDFDTGIAKGRDQVGWSAGVGDHGIDAAEFAEMGDGAATDLGMVEAEDYPAGGVNHRALDIDQEGVGIGDAFESDASAAHDRDVGKGF